jgi:Icc-related predicted phosphoesterase
MRILAVSDRIVDFLYSSQTAVTMRPVDLVVGCGDLPYFYLEFLASALDGPLVYVHGNHDLQPQYTHDGRVLTGVQGGVDVHRRVVQVAGLHIAGLEGSMRYRPNAAHMFTEWEMTRNVLAMAPILYWCRLRHHRPLDLLVTHSPPLNVHDGRDLAHRGFAVFLTFIKRFKPRYLLHGHVHVYRSDVPRVTRVGPTKVINVYPFRLFRDGELGAG